MADPQGVQAQALVRLLPDSECSSDAEAKDEPDSDSSSTGSSSSSSSSGSSSSSSAGEESASSSGDDSSSSDSSDEEEKEVLNNSHTTGSIDRVTKEEDSLPEIPVTDSQDKSRIHDHPLVSINNNDKKKSVKKKVKKPHFKTSSIVNNNNVNCNGIKKSKVKKDSVKTETTKKKSQVKKKKSESQSPSKTEDDCLLTTSDLTPVEFDVLKSIGKIKRQKQRASFDRISNILKSLKGSQEDFDSEDKIKTLLNQCITRGLLQETPSETGDITYREKGPGAAIVALIANRKNALQLAQKYNVDLSSISVEVTPIKKSSPSSSTTTLASTIKKRKQKESPIHITPASRKGSNTKQNKTKTSSSSSKPRKKGISSDTPSPSSTKKKVKRATKTTVKKDILPLLDPVPVVSSPQVNFLPSLMTSQPLVPVLVESVASSSSLAILQQPLTKVCGLCRLDDSIDSLITCSDCGLSGKISSDNNLLFMLFPLYSLLFNISRDENLSFTSKAGTTQLMFS